MVVAQKTDVDNPTSIIGFLNKSPSYICLTVFASIFVPKLQKNARNEWRKYRGSFALSPLYLFIPSLNNATKTHSERDGEMLAGIRKSARCWLIGRIIETSAAKINQSNGCCHRTIAGLMSVSRAAYRSRESRSMIPFLPPLSTSLPGPCLLLLPPVRFFSLFHRLAAQCASAW